MPAIPKKNPSTTTSFCLGYVGKRNVTCRWRLNLEFLDPLDEDGDGLVPLFGGLVELQVGGESGSQL